MQAFRRSQASRSNDLQRDHMPPEPEPPPPPAEPPPAPEPAAEPPVSPAGGGVVVLSAFLPPQAASASAKMIATDEIFFIALSSFWVVDRAGRRQQRKWVHIGPPPLHGSAGGLAGVGAAPLPP